MPYVGIWIHLVWTTKRREPYLEEQIRSTVFEHIQQNAKYKKIYLDCINGHIEHVHCLLKLGATQNIAGVAHLLKGEACRWINRERLCDFQFEWQREYYAVSVSESKVEAVRRYIARQEEHHRTKTFEKECEETGIVLPVFPYPLTRGLIPG